MLDSTDKLDEVERCLLVGQSRRSRGKIPYITENLRFEGFTHRAISSLIVVPLVSKEELYYSEKYL